MNNENLHRQWYQDFCVFTGHCGSVFSGIRIVMCSLNIMVLCSQTGALGCEQRQPAGPVVPGLLSVHSGTKTVVCSQIIVVLCSQTGQWDVNNDNPQGQWYQDCDVFTVVPRLSCVLRSLWFCVHRLEHWDVNNENVHGQWYQDALQDPDYNLELFRIAHHYDPSVKLFLNDYSVVASGDATNVSSYSQHTACKNLDPRAI